jgi:hypothetical protein
LPPFELELLIRFQEEVDLRVHLVHGVLLLHLAFLAYLQPKLMLDRVRVAEPSIG